ncbi:hypothetical protein BACPLE_01522, partial [Phocaeicola plebeius DSM 17135]
MRRSSPFCVPTPDSSPTNFETQKLKDNEEYIFSNLLPQASGSEKGRDSSRHGRITVDGSQTQFSCKLTVDPKLWDTKRWTCHGQKHGGTRNEP